MGDDLRDDRSTTDTPDDFAASAVAELERAAKADDEARLQVLEDVYRSLETQLDSAGSDALR